MRPEENKFVANPFEACGARFPKRPAEHKVGIESEAGIALIFTPEWSDDMLTHCGFPLLIWGEVPSLGQRPWNGRHRCLSFQDRSQLKPEEVLANPSIEGAKARAAVQANGLM